MIYPDNTYDRLGFNDIKELIKAHCLSTMGQQMVGKMQVMNNYELINKYLQQTHEFKELLLTDSALTINSFYDIKELAEKAKVEGAFLTEDELFKIASSLFTVFSVIKYFEERDGRYPYLEALFEHLPVEKDILRKIDRVIDTKGKIRPNASPELASIISEITSSELEVRKKMDMIFREAIAKGWTADGSLTVRDGRICIPLLAESKRKLKGFIHDESSSGQTVFIEPEEVFNLNNKVRNLEFDKRREITKILTAITSEIRPFVPILLSYHGFLTKLDLVRAKALFAIDIEANMPLLLKEPSIKLINASHPLLVLSYKAEHRTVVPLNLRIDQSGRVILVSGPNAGGKSVCMKTVGLLQMMLQAGLLVPADASSEMGIFNQIFADIGDDQSIESDLSTYSAHLTKMRYFVENAGGKTLVLIDEFGTGTDPQFGGPMAEAVLEALNRKQIRGVITTHYSNLKIFASNTAGLENASMMFDNRQMKPLYILEVGKPGSSYAFEIAEKIGLPDYVLQLAKQKTGTSQKKVDTLLVDLERDKAGILATRTTLATQQNKVKQLIEENEQLKAYLDENKKAIIKEAKLEARNIITTANKLIENTISEIKEHKAEKVVTKQLRQTLQKELVKHEVKEEKPVIVIDNKSPITVGDWVKFTDSETTGQVLEVNKDSYVLAIGDLRSVVKSKRVQKISNKMAKKAIAATGGYSTQLTDSISEFKTELDLRGMRGEDALYEVERYLDKALMMGMSTLKIIHGKGDGILRKLIREYLKKYKAVSHMEDEHADRGGDGITYVYLS